jgi:apolipoprotein D and lipocalin family protein
MRLHKTTTVLGTLLMTACSTAPVQPIRTADYVDLQRFMGDWYVIANIPTFIEDGAHNAVESYRLADSTTVATTFTFRAGSFEGQTKTYRPTGYVLDTESNAIWGMQFVWPFKADYRIVYVDASYEQTIIGRNKRDYVWVMARTPAIPDKVYHNLVSIIAQEGYDISKLQKVPQQWRVP